MQSIVITAMKTVKTVTIETVTLSSSNKEERDGELMEVFMLVKSIDVCGIPDPTKLSAVKLQLMLASPQLKITPKG